MIEEDYVSSETAKLLKEKGFDVNSVMSWKIDSSQQDDETLKRDGFPSIDDMFGEAFNTFETPITSYCYPLIAIQTAIKWLIEVHKLHIEPTPYPHEDGVFYWAYKIAFLDSDTLAVMVVRKKAGFDSKEKACEEAIKYCLENLI